MDILKLLTVYAAIKRLADLVRAADADKRVTKEEMTLILIQGVIPILGLLGVPVSHLVSSPRADDVAEDVRKQIEAIAALDSFLSGPPDLPAGLKAY